jgi:hypothetical protein
MKTGSYHSRVAVLGNNGDHLRYVTAGMAREMVRGGVAEARQSSGKVREVSISRPAATHATRIGEPSPPSLGGVRFVRWVHLEESSTRVIEHHPRCLYVLDAEDG